MKVLFYFRDYEQTFEFDDDATDEEIGSDWENWLFFGNSCGWCKVKE